MGGVISFLSENCLGSAGSQTKINSLIVATLFSSHPQTYPTQTSDITSLLTTYRTTAQTEIVATLPYLCRGLSIQRWKKLHAEHAVCSDIFSELRTFWSRNQTHILRLQFCVVTLIYFEVNIEE